MLSDKGILDAIANGHLLIRPFDRSQLGTNSYDLVLDRLYKSRVKRRLYSIEDRRTLVTSAVMENFIKECCTKPDGEVNPEESYIGVTREKIKGTQILGATTRSSAARYGIETYLLNTEELLGSVAHAYFIIRTFKTKCFIPPESRLSQLIVDPITHLSEDEIRELIEKEELEIQTDGKALIEEDGVLLHLGESISKYNGKTIEIDKNNDECFDEIDIGNPKDPDKRYKPSRGTFYLGHTYEWIKLPNDHAGMLRKRSSEWTYGDIHPNAPLVSAGSEGNQVLEFHYKRPYAVWAGKRICIMQIMPLDQMPQNPYKGRYKRQKGAQKSRFHEGV